MVHFSLRFLLLLLLVGRTALQASPTDELLASINTASTAVNADLARGKPSNQQALSAWVGLAESAAEQMSSLSPDSPELKTLWTEFAPFFKSVAIAATTALEDRAPFIKRLFLAADRLPRQALGLASRLELNSALDLHRLVPPGEFDRVIPGAYTPSEPEAAFIFAWSWHFLNLLKSANGLSPRDTSAIRSLLERYMHWYLLEIRQGRAVLEATTILLNGYGGFLDLVFIEDISDIAAGLNRYLKETSLPPESRLKLVAVSDGLNALAQIDDVLNRAEMFDLSAGENDDPCSRRLLEGLKTTLRIELQNMVHYAPLWR